MHALCFSTIMVSYVQYNANCGNVSQIRIYMIHAYYSLQYLSLLTLISVHLLLCAHINLQVTCSDFQYVKMLMVATVELETISCSYT